MADERQQLEQTRDDVQQAAEASLRMSGESGDGRRQTPELTTPGARR
jgi:hypothetical protein